MGTGRVFRKKSLRRKKKTGTDRRRRQATHVKRLVALGDAPKNLAQLTPGEVRTMLNAKVKAVAKAKRAGAKKA